MIFFFDVETRNHLKIDCAGDLGELRLGCAGLLPLRGKKARFFGEEAVGELAATLEKAEGVLGFNLTGGFDYTVLENYNVDTRALRAKTIDLMPFLIRAFGSHKNFSLDNLAEHTLGRKKIRSGTPRYKLAVNDPVKLQVLIQQELELIRSLYRHIDAGKPVRFKTSVGLIDEHEVYLSAGQDCPPRELMMDPYDFPVGGMRLEIKNAVQRDVSCKCKRRWRVTSRSYYGDTMSEDVPCPACGASLGKFDSSLMGHPVEVVAIERPIKGRAPGMGADQ